MNGKAVKGLKERQVDLNVNRGKPPHVLYVMIMVLIVI